MNNFAVLILTNNRPEKVITIKNLRDQGYTGRIVLVLDDQDKTLNQYKSNYPNDEFYVFNKQEAMNLTDSADNTNNPKAVVYARNMCFKIASDLGLEYFLELDDDYTGFRYTSNSSDIWERKKIKSLDKVFQAFVEFLSNTNIQTIAFAQGGDFIGGHMSMFGDIKLKRKAMNSFFCKTDRPFMFYGLINEDVNMYVVDGSRGKICFTASHVQLDQIQTQANSGGLTTIYLELGTYVKSFYSVMYHPSSVVVKEMGTSHKRIHHSIKSELTYPKIISESYKKLTKSER
jgi:hypothetical protein